MHGHMLNSHASQKHQHRHIAKGLVPFLSLKDIGALHRLKRRDDHDHFWGQGNAVLDTRLHTFGRYSPNAVFQIDLSPALIWSGFGGAPQLWVWV